MKVGIVAGEKSGDYLGAELIRAIKIKYPNAEFVGLAGPLMKTEGAVSLAEMDKISIMGIVGALKGLKDILSIRRRIRKYMLQWRPDVFLGIDVPDFNLGLEIKLKKAGIPTVHYVSPTVWAWRGKRIVKIKRAVNLMLTLFPFEEDFYQKHQTAVKFVGHPLAKQVLGWRLDPSFLSLYDEELSPDLTTVAILPGSRMSEVSRLAPIMLDAAAKLQKAYPELRFLLPAANPKLFAFLKDLVDETSAPVTLVDGNSRDVLSACKIAILASGTAALEAALFAKPMVVMYKVAKIEERYAARTMVVKHFSMPNHLTDPPVVPELIQEKATSDNLVREVARLLNPKCNAYQIQKEALSAIAPTLSIDSGRVALEAIEALIEHQGAMAEVNQ